MPASIRCAGRRRWIDRCGLRPWLGRRPVRPAPATRWTAAASTAALFLLAPAPDAAARICGDNPLLAVDRALSVCREGTERTRASLLDLRRAASDQQSAAWHLEVAEVMKCLGDPRAVDHYEGATVAEPDEPGYELFYADGLEKTHRLRQPGATACAWDDDVAGRLDRGVVALYQEDGLPVLTWRSAVAGSDPVERPLLFLGGLVRHARATGDLDQSSDVRDYSSEAAFAQSRVRRNAALDPDQLRQMIRAREPFETVVRARLRYKDMPALDGFLTSRRTVGAQVTDFFEPFAFSDLRLTGYGFSATKPFTAGHGIDVRLEAGFRKVRREGLIEFLPDTPEDVRQLDVRAAISRYAGPDRVTASLTFAHQDITPGLDLLPARDRTLASATFTYQIFRRLGARETTFGRRFETRGIDLFAGTLHDREAFPAAVAADDVVARRRDYFVGVAARGLGRFDVTVQPTFFTARVDSDPSQDNSQYRTHLSVLYRIVDEEARPRSAMGGPGMHLAFLHVVVPIAHDVARTGLDAFESYRAGVELHAKFFSAARRGVTFLASVRYEFQRYYALDRNLNLFGAGVSMGM
jgi:hypothetical protein